MNGVAFFRLSFLKSCCGKTAVVKVSSFAKLSNNSYIVLSRVELYTLGAMN